MHLTVQIACYELKPGNLSPVMLEEISKLKEFVWKTMQARMAKSFFVIRMRLPFGGRCNRYFSTIRLKILRLPNFNSERSDFIKYSSAVR